MPFHCFGGDQGCCWQKHPLPRPVLLTCYSWNPEKTRFDTSLCNVTSAPSMHQHLNVLLTPWTKKSMEPMKTAPAKAFCHSSPNCFLVLSHQVGPFFGIPDVCLIRFSKCAVSLLLLKPVWVKSLTTSKDLELEVWLWHIGLANLTPRRNSDILNSENW